MAARHLLVSGSFGLDPSAVHPSSAGSRSLFFTNNAETAENAEKKGWEAVVLDGERFAPTDDPRISALQSKYVKFFGWRRDYPDLARYEWVTYCDHKAHLQDAHLVWLLTTARPDAAALLRYSPQRKDIQEEIRVASKQPRYAEHMPQTVEWLDELRNTRAFTMKTRIVNTGIIHVRDFDAVQSLFDEVYVATQELGQPECQVIWAALAQRYDRHVQYVEWFDVDVPWATPRY